MKLLPIIISNCISVVSSFTTNTNYPTSNPYSSSTNTILSSLNANSHNRRSFIIQTQSLSSVLLLGGGGVLFTNTESAVAATATSLLLDDLPPEAKKSYLQYRIPLQVSADYYVWELQSKVADVDEWGEVNSIFQVNNNKGQGIPSRVERDFVNPMRILGLSMPPDIADELRDAQFAFEKAAFNIGKATKGVKRDMPVEVDPADVELAKASWEEGRIAINQFFETLNTAVGLDNELQSIPPSGPDQNKIYGRSQRRYFDLTKKTRLCQNRGGPTLSQAWGGLMVTGYLQDSCGIPDMEDYFYQR